VIHIDQDKRNIFYYVGVWQRAVMKCTKVYNARASGQCYAKYVSRSRRSCDLGLFIVSLIIYAVHRGLLYICRFTYSQSVQ